MGFDEKAISEKRVHIKSSNGYIMDYTDGEQIKQIKYDDLQFYEMIVQTECIAVKMECLWESVLLRHIDLSPTFHVVYKVGDNDCIVVVK